MTTEEFISLQPEHLHSVLNKINRYLSSRVPNPHAKYIKGFMVFTHHYNLVGFGVINQRACIYFLKSHFFKKYSLEFSQYDFNGTTLYIDTHQDIPQIVEVIIQQRIKENEELNKAKMVKS